MIPGPQHMEAHEGADPYDRATPHRLVSALHMLPDCAEVPSSSEDEQQSEGE